MWTMVASVWAMAGFVDCVRLQCHLHVWALYNAYYGSVSDGGLLNGVYHLHLVCERWRFYEWEMIYVFVQML